MQTVTLEFETEALAALGIVPPRFFERYEEVELLETLRLESGWRLQLLRLRSRGSLRSERELEQESRRIRRLYGLEGFELVERRPRTRDYVLLVRQKNPTVLRALIDLAGGEVAPIPPFRVGERTAVATFRGEEGPLRRILARLRKEEIPFRVLRTTSRPVLSDPGSEMLTDRQRSVLARAWTLGYYAVPRRITLTRLAQTTGQSPPALGKMLRRAERHLVSRFLSAEPPQGPGAPGGPGER
ncbi:MAG TPA: helix-turn-helix domain-containing protein [Thermoplasmata archaeon]|nr:helix-turn-helix domain-containing protein [Thermoplasmata archaeon]